MSYETFTTTMHLRWLDTILPKRICSWEFADSEWIMILNFDKFTDDPRSTLNLQIVRNENCLSWNRKSSVMIRVKKLIRDQTTYTSSHKIIELQKPFESTELRFSKILKRSEIVEENDEYPVEITLIMEKFENSLEKVPKFDFKESSGSPKSDVILNIDGVKIYANKTLLAIHSKVFDSMFFSEFVEKNQTEIILEDDDPDDFMELLKLIYPSAGSTIINDSNVDGIYKLADKYFMTHVMFQCEHFMETSKDYSVRDWLVAEKYDVPELMKKSKPTFVRQLAESFDF
ncbi:unnamed protein product [Caenorhabditis angaria]|uniref:BTB domain-containing protein n=1 Tax=Caenorhabditis angaria TaxID=860376 RepID=A0A9P1J7Z8_9PELO|nr:unnamed protein product [Caenorhabditis angaria]